MGVPQSNTVRCQSIWVQGPLKLRDDLVHLVNVIMRRFCCVRSQRQKMRYERRLPCRREAKESVIGVVRSMDQPAHLQVEIFNCFCEERAVTPTSSETKGRKSVLQIGY